ncbi:F-box/WD repeat-containing protein 9 isoform X2 [Silurus meridionalis]|uniref:F-box/WD repeat-containing protein 9 isoform X2 n=1 Tax=Silurus meridionalis TaxID=175797 RepID=UPI001EEC58B0|nr:F-box/WD repeat-containing protein 9 isoform X2 [Silurus meridionalis]
MRKGNHEVILDSKLLSDRSSRGGGGGGGRKDGVCLKEQCDPPQSTHLGVNLKPCGSPTESSSSTSGLLSLPWEMVVCIASHLPAQCIINILPKVCRALGQVGEDVPAWQLRAQRLTGPNKSFPVGPRNNFDWLTACLEMEQLIESWAGFKEKAKPEQGIGIQEVGNQDEAVSADEEGAGQVVPNREADAERQPGPAGDEIRPEGEEGPERHAEGEEQDNNVIIMREEGRENDDRLQDGHQDHEDRGINITTNLTSALEHITLSSGHIADVNTVLLVGGEGSVCVSGSRDRNVNLWDMKRGLSGTLVCKLGPRGQYRTTHEGWVWCLAASGDLLASGSFDSTVKLWDLNAGGAERGNIQSRSAVLSLSCQDHMLFAGSHDQKVSIYDTRAADPLVKSLHLHRNIVLCLASDEQYIISASKDNTVAVFDRRAGKPLKKIHLTSYLFSMSYSGREIWAGDYHGLLHTFSMNEGSFKSVAQFNVGHSSRVTGVHNSAGTLYTCSSDRTIKVHLPCAPPKTLCTLHNKAVVNGLSVEAGVLAVASGDENVEVWRPKQ